MTDDTRLTPEERYLEEMVPGYLDRFKPDNPEPSANRSLSYRHGFANGRDDLAHSPRLPAQALRLLADQVIREDVEIANGSRPAAPGTRSKNRGDERTVNRKTRVAK